MAPSLPVSYTIAGNHGRSFAATYRPSFRTLRALVKPRQDRPPQFDGVAPFEAVGGVRVAEALSFLTGLVKECAGRYYDSS